MIFCLLLSTQEQKEHVPEALVDVAYTRYPLLRYFCGIFLAVLFTINLVVID